MYPVLRGMVAIREGKRESPSSRMAKVSAAWAIFPVLTACGNGRYA